MTTRSVGQAAPSGQPPPQAPQSPLPPGALVGQGCGQGEATAGLAQAPACDIVTMMKAAPIWLLWKSVRRPEKAKPDKVPYYADGSLRLGTLDTVDDRAKLVTYEAAAAAVDANPSAYAGLGIALGEDNNGGFWQGIDLDCIVARRLTDIADLWTRGACGGLGYVEISPSGEGLHIIGYGRHFRSLGSNGSGIEAYAGGRFFTFTGKPVVPDGDHRLYDLAAYAEQALAPRHGALPVGPAGAVECIAVDPKTVTELRSALAHMPSDDRDLWVRMGHALKELGNTGLGLWTTWSQGSAKYEPRASAKAWSSFRTGRTGYQAVFAEATRQGWVNPASKLAQLSTPQAVVSEFQARTPRNFLNTATAPLLDLANVPYPIAQFAQAFTAAHGFDRSGAVMAAIAAAAAVINDGYVLEAKPGWRISARLWTVLIGKSAAGKSPTIKAATAPVKAIHSRELAYFYATYDPDPQERVERPPEPALYTSDSTIEALSERLTNNPRGMLMVTEEFASWIGAIDSTGKGDAAKNRGAWLQLYDGGPYQIDRIGRKSYEVPNWGASVLTATTPSSLAEHMKHLPEDGLIQRFIPVILAARDYDADGDASAAQDLWYRALAYVFEMPPATVRFSPEAKVLFKRVETELGRMATAMDDTSPALASHIGKHSEMTARIALVFHVFETQPGCLTMSAETLTKAINLMKQLQRHSLALFTDILGRSPATEVARSIARSLAAADPLKTLVIGRDWMTQHCRAFEKAKDDRVRREAVQLLEDLDWLRDVSSKSYGGWPTKFEVNRNIFRLYAKEGEAHRAQRAAVQALFSDQQEA